MADTNRKEACTCASESERERERRAQAEQVKKDMQMLSQYSLANGGKQVR
ncbi:MAG: hypothetical protein AB7E47_02300 [Desulfovibrionaceae bacterium]